MLELMDPETSTGTRSVRYSTRNLPDRMEIRGCLRDESDRFLSAEEVYDYSLRVRFLCDATSPVTPKRLADAFVTSLRQMARDRQIDAGIDAILERFNDKLSSKEFLECEKILANANPSELPEEFVVAILTSTFAAKGDLRARSNFLSKAREHYVKRNGPHVADHILSGLA